MKKKLAIISSVSIAIQQKGFLEEDKKIICYNFLARLFEAVAPEQLFAARRGYSCRISESVNEHGNVLRRGYQKACPKN
ncbi:MAG: hypothetical protein EPN85_06510 [Bacteroidetes bacterium]|nr:MAG: hypothetical protein EPN85_06510 [Bacteroidota bacterium]